MNAKLTFSSMRSLWKALSASGKYSEDVHLEFGSDGASCHVLNSSRSAFFVCRFPLSFFESLSVEQRSASASQGSDSSSGSLVSCNLPIKALMNVFKSSANVNKESYVELRLVRREEDEDTSSAADFLEASLAVRPGAKRTYGIHLRDSDVSVSAVYERDPNSPIFFCGSAHVLSELFANLPAECSECTFRFTEQQIVVKSHYDAAAGDTSQHLRTAISISSHELEQYRFSSPDGHQPVEITFNFKSLRPFLSLADSSFHFVECEMSNAGSPAIWACGDRSADSTETCFDAELVLATMCSQTSDGSDSASHNVLTPVTAISDTPAKSSILETPLRNEMSGQPCIRQPEPESPSRQSCESDSEVVAATPPRPSKRKRRHEDLDAL